MTLWERFLTSWCVKKKKKHCPGCVESFPAWIVNSMCSKVAIRCFCLIFSWAPAGLSSSSVLLNRACAGISGWGGAGDLGFGSRCAGCEREICQQSCLSHLRRLPRSTKSTTGKVLLPGVTALFSAPLVSVPAWQLESKCLPLLSSALSYRPRRSSNFVCRGDRRTDKQTFWTAWVSAGEWGAPACCVCTKGALLFSSRRMTLFTESLDNLAAAVVKDVHAQICTDQSLSP